MQTCYRAVINSGPRLQIRKTFGEGQVLQRLVKDGIGKGLITLLQPIQKAYEKLKARLFS